MRAGPLPSRMMTWLVLARSCGTSVIEGPFGGAADDLLRLVAAIGLQPGFDGAHAPVVVARGQSVALAFEGGEIGLHLLNRAMQRLADRRGIAKTVLRFLDGARLLDFDGLLARRFGQSGGPGIGVPLPSCWAARNWARRSEQVSAEDGIGGKGEKNRRAGGKARAGADRCAAEAEWIRHARILPFLVPSPQPYTPIVSLRGRRTRNGGFAARSVNARDGYGATAPPSRCAASTTASAVMLTMPRDVTTTESGYAPAWRCRGGSGRREARRSSISRRSS